MRNIIRADIYRIVRVKGLYITLAVLLTIIVLQVTGGVNMNIVGVTAPEENASIENTDPDRLDVSYLLHSPTGTEAPFQVMGATSNILYIMIPLIIFIGGADFSSGAMKNALAGGLSRAKYYISKLILACVCCALLTIIYVLVSTILATIINGFGGAFDRAFISNVLKIFLPQLLLCVAGVCVGNFFVFIFQRSGGAFTGIYIAFLLVPTLLIMVLTLMNDRLFRLFDYELTMSIGSLTQINAMPAGDIGRVVAVGGGYIVAAALGGYALFRRAEIK